MVERSRDSRFFSSIFHDIPVFGSFREHVDRIAADRRYTVLADNLHHFAAAYARISAQWRPPEWWLGRAGLPPGHAAPFVAFYKPYRDHVDRTNDRANLAVWALQQAARPVAHDPPRW